MTFAQQVGHDDDAYDPGDPKRSDTNLELGTCILCGGINGRHYRDCAEML